MGLSNDDIWEPPEGNQEAMEGNSVHEKITYLKKFGFTPENSKIGDALAKMEKDKLPNFLFREALIFWHSFSSVIKDGLG